MYKKPMQKQGKFNQNRSWKKHYNNDHDNRINEETARRRVSFKSNKHFKRGSNKDWTLSVRAHLEDEDIDMGSTSGGGRGNFGRYNKRGGGRSGSPSPHKLIRKKLFEGATNWYRVTLPYGNKYEKDYIMKILLQNLAPMTFIPITWSGSGTVTTFYIDEFKVAEKLYSLDRQIPLPDGFKLIIRVNNGSPNVDVNAQMKEKMKLTMAKRYNASIKALDLNRFHADPDLQDLFCALFKPIIFLAVVDIIAENIPEIEALNLSDNKIQMLTHFKSVSKKLPNLKILHIGNNKIREVAWLDSMIGLPILDLVLDGNPLCERFKDQDSYISEVRKRFPKVIKLDGLDLPPPICFDVVEEIPLPIAQQTFLCNVEGQGIVRQFLEQYFFIFDSDNRQPLLQAYHENAMFSMTMAYPYGQHQKNSSWLNWYATDNRNIFRVEDSERRHKLLRQGHLATVAFLSEMPTTKHDIHSFTVDLNLFTPQMMLLTVTGIFKELKSGHKVPPVRFFCRTFVIIPAGTGFCIANEVLHVSNATDAQVKTAFKTIVSPPASVSSPAPAPVVVSETSVLNDTAKHQMVQSMAEHSGMNLEWSQKCLQEVNWDFQRAAFIFTELQKQGTIPPEAFLK